MKTPKARILVVEDDPALLRGLVDVLVYNGYEVKGLADGGQGLDAGLKESFDLIVLDVMLPTLDGFSICKGIRQKKPGQGSVLRSSPAGFCCLFGTTQLPKKCLRRQGVPP